MEQLSAQAQAVLNAAEDAYLVNFSEFYNCADSVAAAALRALADQVVPERDEPVYGECDYEYCDVLIYLDQQRIRSEILAIAAELDNIQ